MASLLSKIKNKQKFRLLTEGLSMTPLLEPDDIVYFKKVSFSAIDSHNLVVIKQNSNLFTHRVIYKASNYLVTRGDNNLQSDGKIYPHQIVGKVYQVKRNGKIFNPEDFYLLQSTLYFQEIVKLKKAFEKNKIDFVFLKGLPLHLYFEKTHPSRIYADCDILVDKRQKKLVHKMLTAMKFVTENKQKYKYFQRFLSGDLKELQYSKRVGSWPINLDIHYQIAFSTHTVKLPFSLFDETEHKFTDDFLKNKKNITINDQQFSILNKKFLMFYLLLHFYGHLWSGVHQLEFIAQVAKKKDIDWSFVFSYAKSQKILNFIIPGVYLLKKYYSLSQPFQLLNKNYPNNIKSTLWLFKKLFNERRLFDAGVSPSNRFKKAAFLFLFYEESFFKKLAALLHPQLWFHLIYFFWKIGLSTLKSFFSTNRRYNP